jgi:hypothetical protein
VTVAPIHLGTSSFTTTGWNGSFYPTAMQSREHMSTTLRTGIWDMPFAIRELGMYNL